MKIVGFVDTSTVDFDGNVVSTIFTPGCNFRCPFCYNKKLVLEPESMELVLEGHALDFLEKNSELLDGACITGGEPTLQGDLPEFCKKVKDLGMLVKLDTNGTNSEMLEKLVNDKLVDYVAMDIKAPLDKEKYSKFCGVNVNQFWDSIEKSIKFLLDTKIDYEFRTTIVPGMHTKEDIEEIVKEISKAKLYALQKFQPRETIDPELSKLTTQSDEEMEKLADIARKHVKNVKIRK